MSSVPLMTFADDVENNSYAKSEKGIMDDFNYKNNVAQAHLYIRMGFLRKVYGLLAVQLAFTCVMAGVGLFIPVVRLYIRNNDWLLSLAFLSSIILIIALHIKRKETPTNFILLALFTIVQAYAVCVVATFYDQLAVFQAFIMTFAVVTGLTIFTFQTKRDFSSMGSILLACLMILIVAGVMQMFIMSTSFEIIVSLGGALVFSLFIIFDTQMMMNNLSAEEYILATINLYMDILNLFLYILRAINATRQN